MSGVGVGGVGVGMEGSDDVICEVMGGGLTGPGVAGASLSWAVPSIGLQRPIALANGESFDFSPFFSRLSSSLVHCSLMRRADCFEILALPSHRAQLGLRHSFAEQYQPQTSLCCLQPGLSARNTRCTAWTSPTWSVSFVHMNCLIVSFLRSACERGLTTSLVPVVLPALLLASLSESEEESELSTEEESEFRSVLRSNLEFL